MRNEITTTTATIIFFFARAEDAPVTYQCEVSLNRATWPVRAIFHRQEAPVKLSNVSALDGNFSHSERMMPLHL
jgi:hypothetical protein